MQDQMTLIRKFIIKQTSQESETQSGSAEYSLIFITLQINNLRKYQTQTKLNY
jgi:hypothetical protein